jgi:hypothetical protein
MQVVGRTRPSAGTTHPSQVNGTLEVILCPEESAATSSAAAADASVNVLDSVQAEMIRAGAARLQARSSLRGPAARSAAEVCFTMHTTHA